MLAAVVSENRKLKDSTRCLLNRPTDGYNRLSRQEKLPRASRAKKTPDRRTPKQTAELGKLAELRRCQTEEVQNRQK
jgi:hypothetical protein